jgi:TonB family protein
VPRKTRDRKPVYPAAAIQARISGVVILESELTTTGCVRSARVLRSVHPQLDWAAMRAVASWQFAPATLDGSPLAVIMSVTVNFTLNQ